jgi:hypothetical protein
VWFEGVDPPRIQAAMPNVTALMFVNLQQMEVVAMLRQLLWESLALKNYKRV